MDTGPPWGGPTRDGHERSRDRRTNAGGAWCDAETLRSGGTSHKTSERAKRSTPTSDRKRAACYAATTGPRRPTRYVPFTRGHGLSRHVPSFFSY